MTESQITTVNQSIEVKSEQENALNLKIYVDFKRCNGCGLCVEVCPFGLPQRDFTGKYIITQVEKCTECSACKRNCPAEAIILKEQKGCGCLWNVKRNEKNKGDSCCETSAVEETSCCPGGDCS